MQEPQTVTFKIQLPENSTTGTDINIHAKV
jgi:hypothetical protein